VSAENTIGFLMCDSRIDYASLIQTLMAALPFPVIGGTTLTMPLSSVGNELSAVLTIFEKEGLTWSIAVSDPFDKPRIPEHMKALYNSCISGLTGTPRLLIPFIPLIPGMTADVDAVISEIFSLAGNVPVFGGITTDDLDTTKAAVFAHGKAYSDRMALLALGGNISPVFGIGSRITAMSEYAPAVTESEGNIVRQVDGMPFCDYMKTIGIDPEERINGLDALVQYGPLPVQLKYKLADDDGVPEMRCISYTNTQDGSAVFSSTLPVGTRLNVGILTKDDVIESARECLRSVTEQMREREQAGQSYSMLLLVPCVARYFAMIGGQNLESLFLSQEVPHGLAMSSYYGFCEIAPSLGKNGEIHNRSYNASVVMCAL
jgi:hypothetical protein